MNGNTNDLTSRINECYGSLSKGQKILATYITDNYDKAVFLTAAKMGQVVGVSESTVKLDCNDTEIGNPNGAKHRILLVVHRQ